MAEPNTSSVPWTDVPVKSWDELLAALHSPTMIPVHPGAGGHYRSSYMFRGMSDKSWPLMTSLERLGSPPEDVEQPALRAFGK